MKTSRLFESCALAAALLLIVTAPARAQSFNIRLGLWEVTVMNQGGGVPPMDVSKLTPEQRAQLEAAMKQAMAKPIVTKQCLTKEKLDKEMFEDRKLDPSCKRTKIAETPTVREFSVECTDERSMNIHARFDAITTESVKGTMKLNQGRGGQVMNINSDVTAKWLGPSCGDVK